MAPKPYRPVYPWLAAPVNHGCPLEVACICSNAVYSALLELRASRHRMFCWGAVSRGNGGFRGRTHQEALEALAGNQPGPGGRIDAKV